MRFALASLFFLVACFIFFILWAVSSFLITEVGDALDLVDDALPSGYNSIISLLPSAFGFLCALFFVVGILSIFVLDSFSDEDELYYRRP